MKTLSRAALFSVAFLTLALAGCVNSEGRLRPPDPIGRAIFDALDPGPRQPYASDAAYVSQSGYNETVWVEGRWGRDANGREVWIPGHYAPIERR
jgi:hypothetical protein